MKQHPKNNSNGNGGSPPPVFGGSGIDIRGAKDRPRP